MDVFVNGRPACCLLCQQSEERCITLGHPLQPIVSPDELLAKYSRKANRQTDDAIDIFVCPFCDRNHLTVSALLHHTKQTHDQLQLHVRCPVCTCFRQPSDETFYSAGTLALHMVQRHQSATVAQYEEELAVRVDFCDGEFERLKFLACTIPPKDEERQAETDSICSICLDTVASASSKVLKCGHEFDEQCIDSWLTVKNCCPICRLVIEAFACPS